ncbi:MAG: hypothetical protein M3R17_10540 [Bacteroidota bacterium]|nr:hypothetical protein [Bacteroidota bacterium]
MEDLNENELAAAREIITTGLKKAAESLSFFMKEKITIDNLDYYKNQEGPSWELLPKEDPNIHLLLTEIVGDLKGICCFIFSEKEANLLRNAALPAEITENQDLMVEMSDAIMLEVDNIITASVITQFANILKHKIHGGVPQLKKMTFDQLNKFVKSDKNKDLFSINFKTHFSTSKGNFNPEFLWLLDKRFTESIKKFTAEKNNLESSRV